MSDDRKKRAGEAALTHVRPGMKLGIGTGSTAECFVRALAVAVKDGLDIVGVPTSERTRALCEELGVPLTTLEETPALDLTIDGADEFDGALNLIKGGGGALLREKIVAAASREMIVIADDDKRVATLGAFALPIEVNRFGLRATTLAIEAASKALGCTGSLDLRMKEGLPFETDGGHLIVDASFGHIAAPPQLADALNAIPGVVEHGLFIGLATRAVVASHDSVETVESGQRSGL